MDDYFQPSELYLHVKLNDNTQGGIIGISVYCDGELIDEIREEVDEVASEMELAVIGLAFALEYACDGDVVYSLLEYCTKGFNEWLDSWKARGWRKANRKPITYREHWQEVDEWRSCKYLTVKRADKWGEEMEYLKQWLVE